MPEIEWIREAIKRHNALDIAAATGLSAPTIRNFAKGLGNPTLKTIDTLGRYFLEIGE